MQQTKFTTIIKTPPPPPSSSHGATVLYVSFLFSIFLYFTALTKLVSFARILFVHYPNIFMSIIQIFPRRLFCHIAHRFTGNSDSGEKNLHKQRQTAKSKQNEQHKKNVGKTSAPHLDRWSNFGQISCYCHSLLLSLISMQYTNCATQAQDLFRMYKAVYSHSFIHSFIAINL